jgi:hypothetical protein
LFVAIGSGVGAVVIVAEFATVPATSDAATFAVMATVEVAPLAIVPTRLHVTTAPTALQVQPVPIADANASPAGNVSVTTMGEPTVATDADGPLFLTARLYVT